jgi:hypothetical protein
MRRMSSPIVKVTLPLFLVAIAWSGPGEAQQPPVRFALKFTAPREGHDGQLEIRASQETVMSAIRSALPKSMDLPDQKLDNQLVFKNVQLKKLKANDLQPDKLEIQNDVVKLAGKPTVCGDLQYDQTVIGMERQRHGVITIDVPVTRNQTATVPFTSDLEIKGRVTLSLVAGKNLSQSRIRVDTQVEHLKITKLAIQGVGALPAIITRELEQRLPRDINKALSADIDPFKDSPAEQRQEFEAYKVKSVSLTTGDEVKVTAVLTAK